MQPNTYPYQQCSKCILDTIDYPNITFDSNGVCNICKDYDIIAKKTLFSDELAAQKLHAFVSNLKKKYKNKNYDCIIGLSGGMDSSYLVYLAMEWGLRPLVVHIDNGWNSEQAVLNIKNIVNKLQVDLYTYVINWEEMRDVQKAFILSSVMDIELPFDNAFYASLCRIAVQKKIKYVLIGDNTTTEGILPPSFTHNKLDSINIRAIHKLLGTVKLKSFPTIGIVQNFYYTKIQRIQFVSPLNFVNYNKEEVKHFLIETLDWKDYKYKHFENIFTRFYQGYILPKKFNIDKRKSHFSTLICSGQITRDDALLELKKNTYPNDSVMLQDKNFVLKKIGFSTKDFDYIMNMPVKKHTDFPSYENIYSKLNPIIKILKAIRRVLYE